MCPAENAISFSGRFRALREHSAIHCLLGQDPERVPADMQVVLWGQVDSFGRREITTYLALAIAPTIVALTSPLDMEQPYTLLTAG